MERMFEDAEIDFVGIQEGRYKEQQTIVGHHYTMYIAAATPEGHYGCQVWIRRVVKHKMLAVRIVSDRMTSVIVILQSAANPLCMLSAHAPHSGDDKNFIASWWLDFEAEIAQIRIRYPGIAIALLIDGNARVGSCESPFIGSCDAEKETTPDSVSGGS